MSTLVFEAATIIDVIKRAEKAAPRGADEGDRFAGVMIEAAEGGEYATIRTTNELVYYREVVDLLTVTDARINWRLPSGALARVIDTFTSRSGEAIEFAQAGGIVEITQDRKKAKLGLIDTTGYPFWSDSDLAGADTVNDLGYSIKLVEWTASDTDKALSVRITPEWIYATDRYVMARTPTAIAHLDNPITIEVGALDGLIPQRGECLFKVLGGQLVVAPNDRTQINTVTIGSPFPPIDKAMKFDYEQSFSVVKSQFLKLIKTAQSIMSKTKPCTFRLFIGNGQVAGIMEIEGDASNGIRDIIDVNGADHELYEMQFNPAFLSGAISNAPDETIKFCYNTSKLATVLIDTVSKYQCWVTPIRGIS